MRIKQTLTVALFKFFKDSLSNAFSAITLANPRLRYEFMVPATKRYVVLIHSALFVRINSIHLKHTIQNIIRSN